MNNSNISIIFQGLIPPPERIETVFKALIIKVPDIQFIIATNSQIDFDFPNLKIVLVEEKEGLPYIKKGAYEKLQNNINRQIASTKAGLNACTTKYAIKLRTDCALKNLNFIEYALRHGVDKGKIVIPNLFTIDPTMFEHMTYHFSDWFQFGLTDKLREYWNVPYMSYEDATYYDHHPYVKGSSYLDKQFRPKLAVEQYMGTLYAQKYGFIVPKFHNEINEQILSDFYRFIREHIIVLDVQNLGLIFPKYEWAYKSKFQDLNCISQIDWINILEDNGVYTQEQMQRVNAKSFFRSIAKFVDPLGVFLHNKYIKKIVESIVKGILLIFIKNRYSV